MSASSSPKTAIVTGAAQGIGKAIALKLAQDGFNVVASDLDSQKSLLDQVVKDIEAAGGKALAVICDVSQERDVDNLVKQATETFNGLDVMIANAGIAPLAPLLQLTLEEFTKVHDVNVKGTLLCYQAAAKVMIGQGRGGRIIGACSMSGKKGGPFSAAYASSKFAIRGLTQVAAAELGRFKITVNGYAPGMTETPALERLDSQLRELTGGMIEVDSMMPMVNLGRKAETAEIANVVAFLASDASSYITGQTLTIDGGVHYD
ncbi:hypothetical protein DL96DRAFT_669198 [Flagelloscypha sp. PMI_526]|nr:hypothetical protein DL96DRAFT_669198 [Flagelloscypha sp. PMI_526]